MELRLYTPQAGYKVSTRLKPWDVKETDISHPYWDKFAVIASSVAQSDIYQVAYINEDPIAVFGVGHGGCIWMLSTPRIQEQPREVIRLTKWFLEVAEGLEGYDRFYNHVHKDNQKTLRWLKCNGFKTNNKPDRNNMVLVEKIL